MSLNTLKQSLFLTMAFAMLFVASPASATANGFGDTNTLSTLSVTVTGLTQPGGCGGDCGGDDSDDEATLPGGCGGGCGDDDGNDEAFVIEGGCGGDCGGDDSDDDA